MARTRTVRLEELDGAEKSTAEVEQEELQEADDMEGGDLFAALDEMRGTAGVTFIVVRTFPSTPDMAGYVGSLTPAEFSLERMTELYGPGKYRVRVKGPKGWLPGGGTVAIAKGITPSASLPGAPGGDLAAFMKLMQDRDAAAAARRDKIMDLAIPGAITLLAAVLGKNNGPDITALITAMRPAPGPSITDLVTSLSSLKSLTESPKAEGSASQIETLLTIMEKFKDLSGEGKGETNWADFASTIAREALPALQPLLEGIRANQQRSPTQPLLMPPGVRAASSPLPMTVAPIVTASVMPNTLGEAEPNSSTIPAGENDMLALFMPMIKEQLAKILGWAQANRDTSLYAEVLLEELPEIVHKSIPTPKALEYLKHPHWFEIVTNVEPRLADQREWCDALRLELIEIIEDQLKSDAKKARKSAVASNGAEASGEAIDGETVGE